MPDADEPRLVVDLDDGVVGVAHGFFSLLQKNVLNRRRWRTRGELSYEVIVWIERTYNRRRRQRALGKLTPVEFELAFSPPTDTANVT